MRWRDCIPCVVMVTGLWLMSCSPGAPAEGAADADPNAEPTTETGDPDTGTDGLAVVEVVEVDHVDVGEVYVAYYDPTQTCEGTTFPPDLHDSAHPRIIEVNMSGEVVWAYTIPEDLAQYRNPGMDVEVLPGGNILFVLPRYGVYEIDRAGGVIWSHLDTQISHDADRLANGNTLYVWGGPDQMDDAQVKEVTPDGELVWSWYAKDHFADGPYADIYREGWTHANATIRLESGNTLVSLRNFNLTVEVDAEGAVVRQFDWSGFGGDDPHEPEVVSGDRLLVCLQHETPHQVVEIDMETGELVWEFYEQGLRTARDSDRLANGNTLIQAVAMPDDQSVIMEVTPAGDIVWRLELKGVPATGSPGWFYKAQRICAE